MKRILLMGALLLMPAVVPAAAQRIKVDVPVRQLETTAQKDRNDAVAHYNLALGYWSERKYDQTEAALSYETALSRRAAPASDPPPWRDAPAAPWPRAPRRRG